MRFAVAFVALALTLTGSKLPDPIKAGVADRLYRLDCGHSLANDESVWTPGENVGRNIEFSSTCWLIKHGSEWLLWDTGVPESALNNPQGWSTLPKLIVYHLERSLTDQLAAIGLKPLDIGRVAISHTHGDHIGNVVLFPNATIVMQRAEYTWIHSPNGPNENVNQLMALARKLLGTPKKLQLIDGDTDVFRRRSASEGKFREERRSVPQYQPGRFNHIDGQSQTVDRVLPRYVLHQPRQTPNGRAEPAARVLRLNS